MASLELEIVTSEETVFSGDVDYVSAKSVDGQIGILPNHISLISELDKGSLLWRSGNKEQDILIQGGFIEIIKNKKFEENVAAPTRPRPKNSLKNGGVKMRNAHGVQQKRTTNNAGKSLRALLS